MVFSSLTFLNVFLPITLLLALLAHAIGNARLSNPILLVASIVFYMWGIGASFVLILLASIAINYLAGLWVAAEKAKPGGSTTLPIAASILLNVGMLAYFKYANFFVHETEGLRAAIGMPPFVWTNVALPIGISFFTFHSMSYVFDVASGRARVMSNPINYALYITLFPQLIAGPIVRYSIVSEDLRRRSITSEGLREGTLRFVHGLVKKVVVADSAGAIADNLYGLPVTDLTTGGAWLAAIAYAVQIYFDFSGYSDMAIGLARMLGFKFPENFNRPYAALSITDFWRRWHMTLSNWFRDYVYIPIGGSRHGPVRTYANLWAIFVLTGIWHGANWTFLIWGVYHGALLVLERVTGLRLTSDDNRKPRVPEILARRIVTLFLILIGWVMFRSANVEQALSLYSAMFVPGDWSLPISTAVDLRTLDVALMLLGAAIAVLPPVRFRGPNAYAGPKGVPVSIALMLVGLPLVMLKIMGGTYSPFLYFQF